MTSVDANTHVSLAVYALTHPCGSCLSTAIQYSGIFKSPILRKFTTLSNLTASSLPMSCLEVKKIDSLLTETCIGGNQVFFWMLYETLKRPLVSHNLLFHVSNHRYHPCHPKVALFRPCICSLLNIWKVQQSIGLSRKPNPIVSCRELSRRISLLSTWDLSGF